MGRIRFRLHDTPILQSLGNVTGAAEVYHTTWSSELLLDRAPSLTHPRSLASPIPGIMQRKQVCSLRCSPARSCPLPHSSPIVGVADPWHYAAQTGELLLDRAPSLTHPRSLASPIPGIMQRKQVCSLRCSPARSCPLPHSSPIVGVADPWHYAAQTVVRQLDRAPSLTHPRSLASPIPGIMQRKQVCSLRCSPARSCPLPHSSPIVGVADPWHYAAQTGELLLDRAPSLTHPRSLASPIPGIMQRKQVCSLRCSPARSCPLPHSSPIVGVADPWHYAAQTVVRQLDHTPLPRSHGVVGGAADSRHTTSSLHCSHESLS
ncbi:hypothetical protein BLNAU_11237 [Blattamonas nauphoetae]|uniref:Uncharacterized protein n=1 Tax=Blattamonas nauphoetae TaxID=2049346 RepID=A0ABQ9XQL1_9EUKA|nr:hypothetical protein BLNAU_11237 [Blattamonas nauphoetae]